MCPLHKQWLGPCGSSSTTVSTFEHRQQDDFSTDCVGNNVNLLQIKSYFLAPVSRRYKLAKAEQKPTYL